MAQNNDWNPLAEYWSRISDRAAQEMKKTRFGSEMEAQSGGSSASFRHSDTPEYVSEIISSSPVNLMKRYPERVNAWREELGLAPLNDYEAHQVLDSGSSDFYQQPSQSGGFFDLSSGLTSWLESKAINIGTFTLACILIIGGLIVLALSTDTGKAAVKKGAEIAAV